MSAAATPTTRTMGAQAAPDTPLRRLSSAQLRDFASLAALACEVPFAVAKVRDVEAAWVQGAPSENLDEVPGHGLFEQHALLGSGLFEVHDAVHDRRFKAASAAGSPPAGQPPARALAYYAAVPLLAADGTAFGTIAVMDLTPRRMNATQRATLAALARQLTMVSALTDEVSKAHSSPRGTPAISDETYRSLRQMQMLYLNTFEQAPIGIAYADRQGRFLRVNRAFGRMLGYSPSELETLSIGELTHQSDLGHNSSEIARLWHGEIDCYSLEKRYVRKDNQPIWVRVTAALVRDAQGEPDCSVGFLEEITDRKQMEEARMEADLKVERVHKQLLDASRLAGMSEVASNVLHNVGNVLTSVNVSANLVAECLKNAKIEGLSRAAALLKEREQDLAVFLSSDERGRKLPGYLAQLAEHLQGNQRLAIKELGALRDNIDHIKETVAMQQSYAKLCGVSETVAVSALVEDSLRMNAAALTRHGVTVRREIDNDVPPISVDKHKVLQILVNLIRNAKYACDESLRPDKTVIIRVKADAHTVRISVIDNGVGISPENKERLFRHGFTTRKSGHGFGLHSGALAAKELGGSLTAASDGPGHGATFVLELPRGASSG